MNLRLLQLLIENGLVLKKSEAPEGDHVLELFKDKRRKHTVVERDAEVAELRMISYISDHYTVTRKISHINGFKEVSNKTTKTEWRKDEYN